MVNTNISYAQAIKEVCRSGQPYELKPTQIRGQTCAIFVNAPLTLRDLIADNRSELDFLVYGETRLTFDEVYRQSRALANVMCHAYAIKPGDRVAIAMRNYPEWVITFLAATSIGALAVPLNAWWSPADMAYSLTDSAPALVVVDRERLERLAEVDEKFTNLPTLRVRSAAHARHPSDDWHALLEAYRHHDMPNVELDPDDDAIIFYTSGSTGHPKGVVSSHRAIIHALMSWELDWELRAYRGASSLPETEQQSAMLLTIPLFHVSGCHAAMLSSIRPQRKVVCMPKWEVNSGMELIERERISALMATPAISGDVVVASATTQRDISSLHVLGGGGAPRAPQQVRAIDAVADQLMPATGWGMTETNAIGAGIAGIDYLTHPASAGLHSAVMTLRIMADDGNECQIGHSGELQIRGTSLFKEYWNNPTATAAAFDGDWFRTGDAAVFNADGFLHIVDRIKDIIIRGGENIGCGSVEAALAEHPNILEASVYSIPDERLGEEVGATIYTTKALDDQELRVFLASRLAHFEIPRYVSQRSQPLPRIASGKIAKRQLRTDAIDRL